MKIKIDINKSIEKNAAVYFDKSKKAKKKLEGAKKALEKTKKKIEKLKKEKPQEKKKKIQRKKEWYEKFRWFVSSEGFLCIGGRDATTNEIIIKKYTEPNDIVFHTDISGSPFFVIKAENKKPGEKTIKEVSEATAIFSKAWKLGLGTVDVFYVKPEQVTKKAKSGEYLTKGAFMIYGKKHYLKPVINLAVGIKNDKLMAGPVEAVKKNTEKFIQIQQGSEKTSSIAKKIKKRIGGELDDIIRVLPSGGCKIS